MEAARLDRPRQLDRVPRALDVGDLLALGVGGDVVDRGQMEEWSTSPRIVTMSSSETPRPGLGEVAGDRHDPRPVGSPAGSQLLQAPARARPDQRVYRPLTLQKPLHEVAADEARRAG